MNEKHDEVRMTRQEREFVEMSRYIDVEALAIELAYSLESAVRQALSRRQEEFDRELEAHPCTIAEGERWRMNRLESERRRARRMQPTQVLPAEEAARLLARRWGLSMEPANGPRPAAAMTA